MALITLSAAPGPLTFDLSSTAMLVIDMQRDFLEPGGFGAALGNDVSQLAVAVEPIQRLLALARSLGLLVVHTREGHRSDLGDLPERKHKQLPEGLRIGDDGVMGRILIRDEPGQQIIPVLAPFDNEVVVDKPGKGAFYNTDLEDVLTEHGIRTLLVCGVTTEVCVSSTVREAADRGYESVVIDECCASYFPEFHRSALAMIAAQGGIFGHVVHLDELVVQLEKSH